MTSMILLILLVVVATLSAAQRPRYNGHHNASTLLDRLDPRNSHIVLRGGNADTITGAYQHELKVLTASLKAAFGPQKVAELVDTLAVMVLFSYSFEQPFTFEQVNRLSHLHCSLLHVARNVAPYTRTDVFIWVSATEMSLLPPFMLALPGVVHILPIPESSWQDPPGTTFNENWNYAWMHGRDYYLMGRWRNTFASAFVRDMGYQYMLQIDDDTFVSEALSIDIVAQMRQTGSVMGIRSVLMREPENLVAGLPEFVRYWMATRNVSGPIGPLFEHLTPPNIDGLHTRGFDPVTVPGCFVIIDVHFWFHEVVQDFVNLVLKTGSDAEQRWNDQSIQNMVRLLFVPWNNVLVIQQRIFHSKVNIDCLPDLGCGSSLRAVGYEWPWQDYLEGSQISLLVGFRSDGNLYSFAFAEIPHDEHVELRSMFLQGATIKINQYHISQQLSPDLVATMLVERWNGLRNLRVAMKRSTTLPSLHNESDAYRTTSMDHVRDQMLHSLFSRSFAEQLVYVDDLGSV
jgi:hypothetical protein